MHTTLFRSTSRKHVNSCIICTGPNSFGFITSFSFLMLVSVHYSELISAAVPAGLTPHPLFVLAAASFNVRVKQFRSIEGKGERLFAALRKNENKGRKAKL